MWMLGTSILGCGAIFRDIPQLCLEGCTELKEEGSPCFCSIHLELGCWELSFQPWDWLSLWSAACCSGNVCATQWMSAQRALGLPAGALHRPAVHGATVPFPENTAAPVRALLCAAGAVLLPALELGWLGLVWTSQYHSAFLNPGSTEVLRNKHGVHRMVLSCLHGLV